MQAMETQNHLETVNLGHNSNRAADLRRQAIGNQDTLANRCQPIGRYNAIKIGCSFKVFNEI